MPKYLSETTREKGASTPQERRIPAEKALPSSAMEPQRSTGVSWQKERQGQLWKICCWKIFLHPSEAS